MGGALWLAALGLVGEGRDGVWEGRDPWEPCVPGVFLQGHLEALEGEALAGGGAWVDVVHLLHWLHWLLLHHLSTVGPVWCVSLVS